MFVQEDDKEYEEKRKISKKCEKGLSREKNINCPKYQRCEYMLLKI